MDPVMEAAGSKLGGKKKMAKKPMRLEVERLDDGGFLASHHTDGMEKPKRFAHKDMKSLHDHLDSIDEWQDSKGASDKDDKLPTSPMKPEQEDYQPEPAK